MIKSETEIFEHGLKLLSQGMKLSSPAVNINFTTGGGKVWWDNLIEYKGWRIQKNQATQHCRVLNPKNIRVAWGSEEDILESFKYLINAQFSAPSERKAAVSRLNNTVCVLIHGFAGGVYQMKYLEKYLKHINLFNVCSILLDGHGGSKKDLEKTDWSDWLRSAEREIYKLRNKYSSIIIIGFSMGGLIGSQIAANESIDKLILINTPFYFWNAPVILKDILTINIDRINTYINAGSKASMKSNLDFVGLLEKTKKTFNKIKCPTLILQCEGDETVQPKSTKEIEKRISGPVQSKIYHGGGHEVLEKHVELRDEICQDILQWLGVVLQETQRFAVKK